ncbi:MAG: hypothetical protein NTY16_07630 [Deltaproteobacteria bacterium]|jgi:hypothetical protein|nr:hypothetical protein [Deltaproteobacteria bacterium]
MILHDQNQQGMLFSGSGVALRGSGMMTYGINDTTDYHIYELETLGWRTIDYSE